MPDMEGSPLFYSRDFVKGALSKPLGPHIILESFITILSGPARTMTLRKWLITSPGWAIYCLAIRHETGAAEQMHGIKDQDACNTNASKSGNVVLVEESLAVDENVILMPGRGWRSISRHIMGCYG